MRSHPTTDGQHDGRHRHGGQLLLILPLIASVILPLPAQARWGFTLHGGYFASGTLFKAKSNQDRVWETPDGRSIRGTEIRAELDEFAVGGLRIEGMIHKQLGLSIDVAFTEVDVGGTRRTVANNVDPIEYDQLFIIDFNAAATLDLIAQSNTPYLLAGLGLSSLNSQGSSLDQTRPALVLGAGYRVRSIEGINLVFEARDSIISPDLDEEKSRLAADSFDGSDRLHLWELTAGLSWMF